MSHAGKSQYSAGGMSACGLAALNCARVILHEARRGLSSTELLQRIMEKEICEVINLNIDLSSTSFIAVLQEILNICERWSDPTHLAVDDIYTTPLFETTLSLNWSEDDVIGLAQILSLLG